MKSLTISYIRETALENNLKKQQNKISCLAPRNIKKILPIEKVTFDRYT